MSVTTETQYDALVRQGREAREQADNVQWIEGDLALQIETLPPTERPRDPATGAFLEDPDKALKRYADDIEVKYATLQEYRRTAEAWPTPRRRGVVSFATHRALAALDDRFELIHDGMTEREARKVVSDRTPKANYGGESSWHVLLGQVGDTLLKAGKDLDRFDAAVGENDPGTTREKAALYAEWADDLAARLRKVAA
jgi:hypothetical protein